MKMVKFELVIKCERWNFEHDTSVGQRKLWVPDRNRTHAWPSEHRAGAPSTGLCVRELIESKVILLTEWVHMWQVSCILLGSALPNSSWAVITEWRWWILSSVIKCERWNIPHGMSVGQRKICVPDSNVRALCLMLSNGTLPALEV